MTQGSPPLGTEQGFFSLITKGVPKGKVPKGKVMGFAIIIILSLGGLAVAGVGLGGFLQAGALKSLGQIDAVIMMASGCGTLFLSLVTMAIMACVKNSPRSSPQQQVTQEDTEQLLQQEPPIHTHLKGINDSHVPFVKESEPPLSRNPGPSGPIEASHANTFQYPDRAKNPEAFQGPVLQPGKPKKLIPDLDPYLPRKASPELFVSVESREEARLKLLDPERTEKLAEVQLFLASVDLKNWRFNQEFTSIYRHLLLQGDLDSIHCIFEKMKDYKKELTNLQLELERNQVELPLFFAIHGGNLEIVKILVKNGANLLEDYCHELQILFVNTAVRFNLVEIASYLIKKGTKKGGVALVQLCEKKTVEKQTLLGFAAYHGMKEMVKLLISNQAPVFEALNLNYKFFNEQERTVKECSIFRSSVKLVFDYAMGTDFSVEEFNVLATFEDLLDVSGFNFLGIFIDGQQVTSEMLTQMGFRNTEHALYTITHVRAVTDLARRDQLMNCYTDQAVQKGLGQNFVPLHIAAQKGDIDTIKVRLEEGFNADVNQKFNVKNAKVTALYCAVQAHQVEACRALLEYGADPFIQCKGPSRGAPSTPALLAAKLGAFDILDLFDLSEHLEESNETSSGKHLLHYAVKHNHVAGVQQLINLGADVNARSGHGWTPILYALRAGQEKIFHLLIESGADPLFEVRTPFGFVTNPLTYAVTMFAMNRIKLPVLETLINYYLGTPNWCEAPLYRAVQLGEEEIFKWLHQKGARLDRIYTLHTSISEIKLDLTGCIEFFEKYPISGLEEIKDYNTTKYLKAMRGIKEYVQRCLRSSERDLVGYAG